MADLGDGVLDAMVETAMYVVARAPDRRSQAVFVRVLLDDDKEGAVQDSIIDLAHGVLQDRVFLMEPEGFLRLANSPYCYWVGSATVAELARHPHLEGNAGVVRVGLQTGDDWRFLRLLWEVPTESMVMDGRAGGTWYPFSKTDAAAPWVSPIVLVVKWKHAGREIMSFCDSQGKLRSRPQNLEFYFQPGFSYMLRSTRLVPYIVPTGVIPTAGRAQVYPAEGMEYPLLGLCASNLASAVARFSGEKFAWPKFQASMVQNLPIAHLSASLVAQLTSRIEHEVAARHAALSGYEPHQEFIRPAVLAQQDQDVSGEWDLTSLLGDDLERAIAGSFGLTDRQLRELERDIREAIAVRQSPPAEDADEPESDMPAVAMSLVDDSPRAREEGLVSYCVGIAFGRWDVRIGRDHTLAPPARDAFAPLPVCPPGALVSTDGLPAFMNNIASKGSLRAGTDGSPRGPVASDRQVAPVEEDYPFRVSWTGILASDPGQAEDVVQRAREALAVLCPQDAEEVEQRICATLDVTTLDDYISKPSSFFADHLNRYTGGRRQAPIYWPVSTSSGSYTLWLYYHRLTDQTLYTCVNDFVDPKLRQVGDRLAGLQAKAGRSAADEQELARLADLEVELTDLRDELLRVARFWRPNLNDGVEITAAPLWRLFRHRPWQKRLQGTWEKLEAGEYDWAHLAVSIWPERVVRASLRDRSYAIAHDLEGTLWEEAEVTKRSRGGKETVSREWRPRDLSEEQLDPIVARVKARR